jgi:hypothetical protein
VGIQYDDNFHNESAPTPLYFTLHILYLVIKAPQQGSFSELRMGFDFLGATN